MRRHRRDSGFSLAALIFFAMAASIFIAAAVPAYQMQAKREIEAELIFRGEEYARAIQKYQRRFGVYPTTIDQLISTNNLRFVRRAYKDPMTQKDFRLLQINPDGSITGSKVLTRDVNKPPVFGGDVSTFTSGTMQPRSGDATSTPPGPGSGGGSRPGNQSPPGFGGTSSQGFGGTSSQGFGGTSSQGFGGTGGQGFGGTGGQGFGGTGGQGFGGTNAPRSGGTSAPGFGGPTAPGSGGTSAPGFGGTSSSATSATRTSGFGGVGGPGSPTNNGTGNPLSTAAGIIGVASDSDKESIKIYNSRQKYDEWEFIAVLTPPTAAGAKPPATTPGTTLPGATLPGTIPPGPTPPGPGPKKTPTR